MKRASANSKTRAVVNEEEAELNRRHQSLLQDHLDLQKEVVSKKKKLQAAKQERDILLAETRFLRRRHRHLLMTKSAKTQETEEVVELEKSDIEPKVFSRKRKNDAKHSQPGEQGEEGEKWEPKRVDKKPKSVLGINKRVGKKKFQVQDEVAMNV